MAQIKVSHCNRYPFPSPRVLTDFFLKKKTGFKDVTKKNWGGVNIDTEYRPLDVTKIEMNV